ncbi:MAG TPA: MarR family transcriptional regulator [Clostridiaceae bacterium]|nr:MarR family transcriptional regulator [Clostridiaceae bacterium]
MSRKTIMKCISRQFLDTVAQFNKYDKQARTFGTDHELFLSEIHLIEWIGKRNGGYITEIAKEMNITKGAVSKTVKKLQEKGYVLKTNDSSNKLKVLLQLTEKGNVAFNEHRNYHVHLDQLVEDSLKNCSDKELSMIYSFLCAMEDKCK